MFEGCKKPYFWLIRGIGVIVPRRLRADWRLEWEAELRNRETLLAEWELLNSRSKLDLLRRSLGAFRDALLLQPRRLEDEMFQDLRYGVRRLRAQPGFTAVAVFCLALGIGANTAIFGLVQTALLRPLSVPEPGQIVELSRASEMSAISYPDFTFLRERSGNVLSGLAAYTGIIASFSDGTRSEVLVGSLVSGNYFDVLGVKPVLGRVFLPEEDRTPGTHPVVVISHNFWRNRFDSDPNAIGRKIVLNGHPFTVIGVVPAGFESAPVKSNLWVPAMMHKQAMRGGPIAIDDLLNNRQFPISLIGRLKPGIMPEQAQAALELLNRQNESANPRPVDIPSIPNEDRSLRLTRPHGSFSGPLRQMAETASMLLSAIVVTVLLIACANVANLLLARAATRRKEIAVRLALGATRLRLIRQLLTESALLALLGAVAGLLMAYWINQLLMAFKPPFPPPYNFSLDLYLSARTIGFALLLALITSLLFGIAPALQSSKPDLVPALKDESGAEGRRQRRFNLRDVLVITQMALSLVLLIGAGLLIRSLYYAQHIDLGFKPDNVLQVSFDLNLQDYSEARGSEFYRRMIERVGGLPGVQSVSVTNVTPMDFIWFSAQVEPIDREIPENERPTAGSFTVGQRYLETIGTPLVHGRDFTAQDDAASASVAIISESLARTLWPEIKDTREALGKSLHVINGMIRKQCEVVGIAKDLKNSIFSPLDVPPPPSIFRPFTQNYSAMASLVVRTSSDPRALIPAVRKEVAAIDQNLSPSNLQPLNENVGLALWPARTAAIVLGIFGLLSIVLATIGIYGVMSYTVARRTREIGVRMALGAQPGDVLKLVVGQGLKLATVGAGLGLALAFALTRMVRSLLYGVGPADPATFATVSLFLIGVAVAACYLPARRATRIDPLAALRHE
jgi:putative ABC transport system permease protein